MEEDFPELLERANFERLSKQVWQYETNGHIISFIGQGNSPLDYRVRVTGFVVGDMNDIWVDMLCVNKLIEWVNGQEKPVFEDVLPFIKLDTNPTKDRTLTILTWGVAKMSRKPPTSEKNWFLGVITFRNTNFDLKKYDGLSEEIQGALTRDVKFSSILNSIVSEVETKDYKVISISCTRGRHRSVAMAEILKKYIYPNAQINHLNL